MGTRLKSLQILVLVALLTGTANSAWAETDEGAARQPDLTGTWYMRIRTATDARLAIIGNTHIKSTTHLLVTMSVIDGTLMQKQKTCVVDSRPSRSITRTVLPKAFIDHLPVKSYPVSLTPNDDGTWAYRADLKQQFVGYHGDQASDGIPENDKHPSVFDWDEDGKPGASVLVDLPLFGHIRIYMVQTNHTLLSGKVVNDQSIEGRTRQLVLDQRTIGADNRLLAASPKLTVGKGHDRFEMMRIEAGATCEDIIRIGAGTF